MSAGVHVFLCYPFRTLEWFLDWHSQSYRLTSASVGVSLTYSANVVHICNISFDKGSHLGLKPTTKHEYTNTCPLIYSLAYIIDYLVISPILKLESS